MTGEKLALNSEAEIPVDSAVAVKKRPRSKSPEAGKRKISITKGTMDSESEPGEPLQGSGGKAEKKSFMTNFLARYGTGARKSLPTPAGLQEELDQLAALSDEESISDGFDFHVLGEDSRKKKSMKIRKGGKGKQKSETPLQDTAGGHVNSSNRFPCATCGKSYSSRSYLKKHQSKCSALQMYVDNGNSPGLQNPTV